MSRLREAPEARRPVRFFIIVGPRVIEYFDQLLDEDLTYRVLRCKGKRHNYLILLIDYIN